ncbi:hypothetical protein AMTRI_Chr13g88380 [Amborella trichopoda]
MKRGKQTRSYGAATLVAHLVFLLLLLLLQLLAAAGAGTSNSSAEGDALALLAFKASADRLDVLRFVVKKRWDYCGWPGVKCAQGRVVRLVLEGLGLNGTFADGTLSKLDQLRVLSLKGNALSGPIPDFSSLSDLKGLFLDYNRFTGPFPTGLISLHRLRTIDLSHNNLSGPLPPTLVDLTRLYNLQLNDNRFNGTIPPLNQTSLAIFNVSNNLLTGPVPITRALSLFNSTSFFGNPELCGNGIGRPCSQLGLSPRPFFITTAPEAAQEPQQPEIDGIAAPPKKQRSRKWVAGALSIAGVTVCCLFLLGLGIIHRRRKRRMNVGDGDVEEKLGAAEKAASEAGTEERKGWRGMQQGGGKSGSLTFCAGEMQPYTLEELLRASAEMLGRGTVGTTYKAVLESQLIVSVKRLNGGRSVMGREDFERRMHTLGNLRHPNLVPLRAYVHAKDERLLIYDYQPNGSLFSLIHGSRSARAKPLHWTSCLKIAEDVAQGVAYIHQASPLVHVHGNLKSLNVLLGSDFEACVTDYGLTPLLADGEGTSDQSEETAAGYYRAPELTKSNKRMSSKSDVYSFGVLLLELLTGKTPMQSFLVSMDLARWVRSVRAEDDGSPNDDKLLMLLNIAVACLCPSPDQRPTMRQVLRMIQEVKERETAEFVGIDLESMAN